jgi:hypothetical protein
MADPDPDPDSDSDAVPDADPDSDADPDADADADPDADPDSDPDPDSDADPDPDPDPDADADSDADADADSDPDPDPVPDPDSGSDPDSDPDADRGLRRRGPDNAPRTTHRGQPHRGQRNAMADPQAAAASPTRTDLSRGPCAGRGGPKTTRIQSRAGADPVRLPLNRGARLRITGWNYGAEREQRGPDPGVWISRNFL